MTTSDYLIDTLLVLLVLRQVRESKFDRRALVLPLVIVAVVAHSYLHNIPTGVHDLMLISGFTGVGVLFGTISGLATRFRNNDGVAYVKAGFLAAGVWVFSMSSRFAFAIWASHGGGPSLFHFSVAHHLSVNAWTPALVLMALGEVVTRTLILHVRSRQVLARPATAATLQLVTAG